MLKFQPKTEAELTTFELLPPDIYPFTVFESALKASKSAKNAGKLMVELKIKVHGPNFDAQVCSYFSDWFSEWLLKHFCDSVGLSKEYASGQLDPSNNAWGDRTGWVKIGIEPATGQYKEKNVVLDYVMKKSAVNPQAKVAAAAKPAAPAASGDDLDDLGF